MRQVRALPAGRRAIEEAAARIAEFVDPATGRAAARPAWVEIFPTPPQMVRRYIFYFIRCVCMNSNESWVKIRTLKRILIYLIIARKIFNSILFIYLFFFNFKNNYNLKLFYFIVILR